MLKNYLITWNTYVNSTKRDWILRLVSCGTLKRTRPAKLQIWKKMCQLTKQTAKRTLRIVWFATKIELVIEDTETDSVYIHTSSISVLFITTTSLLSKRCPNTTQNMLITFNPLKNKICPDRWSISVILLPLV